jgi:hypothetical protein
MKESIYRWGKVVLVLPIVLIWDATYFIISNIYKGATWIDKNGGNYLDSFIEEKTIWRK